MNEGAPAISEAPTSTGKCPILEFAYSAKLLILQSSRTNSTWLTPSAAASS